LTAIVDAGLPELGLHPLCAWYPNNPSAIVAFQYERNANIHAALESENVQVMHNWPDPYRRAWL
jgi:hypothetical protein